MILISLSPFDFTFNVDDVTGVVCAVGVVFLVVDRVVVVVVVGLVVCLVVVGVVRRVVDVLDDVDKLDCIVATHLYLTW